LPIILVGEKLISPFIILRTDKEAQHVMQSIEKEKGYLLQQAKEIVNSQVLNPYIASNDVIKLIALTNDEKMKRNISVITAINKDGIALSRVPLIALRGDYHFQIYPWGRVLSTWQSVTTVGVGRIIPLLIVGGYPILRESILEGAVVTAYSIDDEYTRSFHSKYLPKNIHLAFYSQAEGIVGDTFTNSEKKLVRKYFNSGTDFIQKNQSNFLVRNNKTYYFVKNISFEGLENTKPGGMLIFLPRFPLVEGIFISTIISILFFILGVVIHRRHRKKDRLPHSIYLIVLLSLALFIANLAIYLSIIENKTFNINELPQTIYNSILKFEPEWGIIDFSAEQFITIKLISGGETINVAQANIEYDPLQIKVLDIITIKSFCDPNFFIEKNIDNENGLVTIICGRPSGFTDDIGILAELLVQPLQSGEFSLHFGPETKVLAHDGLGTNVLRQATNASFNVLQQFSSVSTSLPSISTVLFSYSHPNNERWYKTRNVIVSWPRISDRAQYLYAIDQSADTSLHDGQSTTDNILNIQTPGDGIYYMHVAAVDTKGNIGSTAHIKIKVDSTPPATPSIKASDYNPSIGEVVRIEINSNDEMSGLQKTYYYKVNDGIRLPLGHELAIPFQESGTYIITARAFDNAGNFSDADITIKVK